MRLSLLCLLAAAPLAGQSTEPRPIALPDLSALRGVSDPQLSPDGQWVAYTVRTTDTTDDKFSSDIWMTSWDGRTTLRLTTTPKESEHTPRWSPDGRWLAFLSGRGDEHDSDQLWLLPRAGGEAEKVSEVPTGVSDYAWSPAGDRLALVIEDGDSVEVTDVAPAPLPDEGVEPGAPAIVTRDSAGKETEKPLVIERFWFKEDYTGYVRRKRSHLYLFALADRKPEQITFGAFDEALPSWSPDGRYLAFASKRVGTDPDRGDNYDLWVMPAERGALPRALTSFGGPDASPDWESPAAWSPDAHTLAYLQGGPDSLIYYAGPTLATTNWAGTAPASLPIKALDRWAMHPAWSADGKQLYFLLEDDRSWYLARVPAAGGAVERLAGAGGVVEEFSLGRGDRVAFTMATPGRPTEVYALEPGGPRQLTHQNDSLLATLRLAPVEDITTKSADGTEVHGFLVRPLDHGTGRTYATILTIHGGPVSQYQREFDFYWQLLAANGYAVVAMNPRGSSGRGQKYALAIWADWGNKDGQDVLAGVDYAVKQGIADPDRLGVGGWSYGGILTDQLLWRTQRFKAATSGASIANVLAGYGTDQYVREYEAELGTPWKNTPLWIKLSAPFLHADRITTPTLFLCGEKDFNVPLLNSEQMYQALRSLGVPTKLVIYPGQYHGLGKPSYQRHRYQQYLDWYRTYIPEP